MKGAELRTHDAETRQWNQNKLAKSAENVLIMILTHTYLQRLDVVYDLRFFTKHLQTPEMLLKGIIEDNSALVDPQEHWVHPCLP